VVVAMPGRVRRKLVQFRGTKLLGGLGLLIAVSTLLAASGCGGSGMHNNNGGAATPKGTFTVFVNGIAGQHFHSLPVTLTVN